RYLETEADQEEERQRPTDDLDLCSPACIEDVRAPETHERGQPSTTVAPASSEPAEKGPSLAEVAETEEPTAWTSLQWQDDFTGAGHEPLKGKQFNDMIMAKASAGEILDLLDVSLLEFSVVNAVTALHRIAKAEDGHRWRKDPRIHYLNRRITAMFTSSKKDEMDKKETGRRVPGEDWVYYIDTRSLCNAAWAFAHLGLKHDAMMDIVSEETCRKIFDCSAQQLAMCAWSFAKMSRRDLQLMQSLADEAVQRLAEFSPQHIMNTVWACAKLNFLHVRLLVAIADAALPLLEDFTPQHLSITAWGLATLGFRHLPLMDGIAKEVLINLRAFKAQNIANTAWAYSTLGIYQRDLFDKLADFSTPRLRHFSPQNLSNLVWSYSNMRLRHEGLFQAVAKETCARIDEFDPKALAMLTSSFASMRVRHEVLFEAVRCAAETRLDSFQARDLESLAVAFATAQIRADSLFEAIVRRSRTMLADFNSLDLANLALALRTKASWEDPDTATADLLSDIARHAIPQLRAGNAPSQALVDFAWSFRALPLANLQDFWTAWSSEVLRKMSRHDLRHLVALEALSPAPTRAAVGQQLGRVTHAMDSPPHD
ncbi:tbrg4, partial [Symbiodinium sp. CCMP2456]